MKKEKIPNGAAKILKLIGTDMFLCCNSSEKEKGGFSYFVEPSGKHLNPISARWLIEKGKVEPCADGLFEGTSQSYRAIQDGNRANA